MILQAVDVHKSYDQVHALRGLDLSLAEGEFVALTGPSGCGKSTLLTVLSGLDLPTRGQILLAGQDLTAASEAELARMRNEKIGFVFQSFHLVGSMTSLENVAFPAELGGDASAVARAQALLERVGLRERTGSFPHQLSGGEKQRVAICRALINRPALLFADEPTGNLDSENGEQVMDLLLELRAEHSTAMLLVSHSPEVVARADRVVAMRDGRVVI